MGRKQKRKPTKPRKDYRDPVTPERAAKGDMQSAGMAYRAIPVIDTLKADGTLSERHYGALKHYRDQASLADKSPVKSGIDFSVGGGGHGPGVAITSAAIETAKMENEMGALYPLARAVCVDDLTLRQWCMKAYGTIESGGKIRPIAEARHMHLARLELRFAASRIMGVD